METPPPQMPESNYPRPHLVDDKQSLREVATGQRTIIYVILGQIVVFVINRTALAALSGFLLVGVALIDLVLAVVVFVLGISSVARLAKALGYSQVLFVILMLIPCVSLITLLWVSSKATERLKAAGIKVGLMGADPNSI